MLEALPAPRGWLLSLWYRLTRPGSKPAVTYSNGVITLDRDLAMQRMREAAAQDRELWDLWARQGGILKASLPPPLRTRGASRIIRR